MLQGDTHTKTNIGRLAESRSERFLVEKYNYKILARNFKWKRGEADLVFADSKTNSVVLVEVRSAQRASPWLRQSVGPFKLRCLQKTLEVFLQRYPQWQRWNRRIEIVWIEGDKLEHWRSPL